MTLVIYAPPKQIGFGVQGAPQFAPPRQPCASPALPRLDLPAVQTALGGALASNNQCVGFAHLTAFLISYATNLWPQALANSRSSSGQAAASGMNGAAGQIISHEAIQAALGLAQGAGQGLGVQEAASNGEGSASQAAYICALLNEVGMRGGALSCGG